MAVLVEGGRKREQAPSALASPGLVTLKNAIWHSAVVGSGD